MKDVKSWLESVGISTLEGLQEFWNKMDLEGDLASYDVYFSKPPPAPKREVISSKEEKEETWHVPAAKRPLTKSSRKKTSKAPKKPIKKSSRSD